MDTNHIIIHLIGEDIPERRLRIPNAVCLQIDFTVNNQLRFLHESIQSQ